MEGLDSMDVKSVGEYSAKGRPSPKVYQGNSSIDGLGLFAKEYIPNDTVIHETHVWSKHLDAYINIKPNSMYNHSKNPNCKIIRLGNILSLKTITDIKVDEELLVDYNKNPDIEKPKKDWK